ncbi:hypothetical protein ACFVT1_34105 [Streptomyces sp. NPDC057963]|uniref:hypothetical protein n=1 Tax=Streptomyces sp. NPDC057963 TaxID=3346290 RepID=UPI0036EEEC10
MQQAIMLRGKKKPHSTRSSRRRVRVIEPIKHLIGPMLEQGLDRGTIRNQLIGEHGITLHIASLANYARTWRLGRHHEELPRPRTAIEATTQPSVRPLNLQ